jgi:hypothetical protein
MAGRRNQVLSLRIRVRTMSAPGSIGEPAGARRIAFPGPLGLGSFGLEKRTSGPLGALRRLCVFSNDSSLLIAVCDFQQSQALHR